MALQGATSRIIVMGTTGSGKSTFINLLSGSALSVSDRLKSCTSEVVESSPFALDKQSVILIDTPGFDDTTRSDTDIITAISTYLANIYKEGLELSGVVYMHRISDTRMGGASLLSFRIFRELCGRENLCNALIVTTMWSGVDPKLGESREQELATADDLFKPVLDHGGQLVRHDGTLGSAQSILYRLITNKSTTLRIQQELVDEGRALSDTAAGAELARFFAEKAKRVDARSQRLHKQLEDTLLAEDQEGWDMLQLELGELQAERRSIMDENERLQRMMPSTFDFSVVQVSTQFIERLKETQDLHSNLGLGFPTRRQARVELQEQFGKLKKARKCSKNENERLQNEASAVSEDLEHLRLRCRELYDGLQPQAEPQFHAWDEQAGGSLAKQIDETREEIQEIRHQIDLATEMQAEIMTEVRQLQERSGRTYRSVYEAFTKAVGWMTYLV